MPRPVLVTEAREWRRLYEDMEFTLREIARRYDRSETTIKLHLHRQGVELRGRGRRPGTVLVSNESIARCKFYYERLELSINQIAAIERLNFTSVRDRLLHGGVELRERGEAIRLRGHFRPEEHPRSPEGPFVRREPTEEAA